MTERKGEKDRMQVDPSQVSAIGRDIVARVARRLRMRFHGALAFMVATSWMMLFDDAFARLTGDAEGLGVKLAHAIAFTVLAAVLTAVFDDDDDESPMGGASHLS